VQLLGRTDEAAALFDKGKALEPQSAFTGVALGFKLMNPVLARRPEDLPQLLEEAWPLIPERVPATWGQTSVLFNAAQASAIAGLDEYVEKLYDRIVDLAGLVTHSWFDGTLTRRVAAMCAARLQRWDEAEEHLNIALRQVEEMPNRMDAARVHYWYGRVLAERGRFADAREHFEKALDGFRRIGMPLHVEWTEERLRELSTRV
jgi:tetratricopeptide (TPR) repeat protein